MNEKPERVSEYFGKNNVTYALYKCHCGKIWEARMGNIRSGSTKSCGCSRKKPKTHGKKGTKVYAAWSNIIDRCLNRSAQDYEDYGGRGIKVCAEWHYFENFYEDMGDPPSKEHSIDRIDVNGHYCKENCKWSTWTEQARNRTNNILLVDRAGNKKTIAEWAKILGVPYNTLYSRYSRHVNEWSDDDILYDKIK